MLKFSAVRFKQTDMREAKLICTKKSPPQRKCTVCRSDFRDAKVCFQSENLTDFLPSLKKKKKEVIVDFDLIPFNIFSFRRRTQFIELWGRGKM